MLADDINRAVVSMLRAISRHLTTLEVKARKLSKKLTVATFHCLHRFRAKLFAKSTAGVEQSCAG